MYKYIEQEDARKEAALEEAAAGVGGEGRGEEVEGDGGGLIEPEELDVNTTVPTRKKQPPGFFIEQEIDEFGSPMIKQVFVAVCFSVLQSVAVCCRVL